MNVLEINHAVLYCSKLSEVEISVEEQLEKLRKFCKHFDLQIVREYVDTDIINKPLFNQLIKDIKDKKFNIVVSYNFDTLSKNDMDLNRLICELEKYNCELHLEDTYIYTPVPRPLFKVDRRERPKENVKKRNMGLVPIFEYRQEKNPKTIESINWVKMFDVDTISFVNNELFDNKGNYLGVSRDLFVIFKDLKGCYRKKKKTTQSTATRKLW